MPQHRLTSIVIFLFLLIATLFPPQIEAANAWQKYPGNPIFSVSQKPYSGENWDSIHVNSPSVIHVGNSYLNFHEGNAMRIGLATSPDGISNWTRMDHPILPLGTPDGWENATNAPTVLYINGIYRMWYSSVAWNWILGPDRYRLSYAESPNGIDWTKINNWILKGTPGSWDEGGIRERSILYLNGTYHMWYTGTDSNSSTTNPYWRIGYATSPDGINWTKQNNGQPVINPTEPWELSNISFPTVIYSNGHYHMWYAASTNVTQANNDSRRIIYAHSTDGISWIKPPEFNPVLQGTGGAFDQNFMTISTVLDEDGQLKMWYSGNGPDGYWKIGYATASASILSAPFITPTPTPTPTATPTPTPTPTPPPPKKKVVVIPGFGGSLNLLSILSCSLTNMGQWTLNPLAESFYNPLLTQLSNAGYEVLPFYYDWRKQIPTDVAKLSNFIEANTEPGEKVDIVGHSMGGLVARAYVENKKTDSKIDKLLTVGSPHRGVLLAYGPWEAGRVTNDLLWRSVLTLELKHCGGIQGNDRLTIRWLIPSIKNMLPIFNYLRDQATGIMKPENSMTDQNNWINPVNFVAPFYGVTVGTLSGTGFLTPRRFVVTPRSAQDAFWGNWIDGKPVKTEKILGGDDTVLLSSSQIVGAQNRIISETHLGLVQSDKGIGEILNFLSNSFISAFSLDASVENAAPPNGDIAIAESISQVVEPKSALIIIGYPASLWVTEPDGTVTRDTDSMVAILNPQTGSYRIKLVPTSDNTQFIVTQLLDNGQNLLKEYTFTNTSTKYYTLQFDTANLTEDILR